MTNSEISRLISEGGQPTPPLANCHLIDDKFREDGAATERGRWLVSRAWSLTGPACLQAASLGFDFLTCPFKVLSTAGATT